MDSIFWAHLGSYTEQKTIFLTFKAAYISDEDDMVYSEEKCLTEIMEQETLMKEKGRKIAQKIQIYKRTQKEKW